MYPILERADVAAFLPSDSTNAWTHSGRGLGWGEHQNLLVRRELVAADLVGAIVNGELVGVVQLVEEMATHDEQLGFDMAISLSMRLRNQTHEQAKKARGNLLAFAHALFKQEQTASGTHIFTTDDRLWLERLLFEELCDEAEAENSPELSELESPSYPSLFGKDAQAIPSTPPGDSTKLPEIVEEEMIEKIKACWQEGDYWRILSFVEENPPISGHADAIHHVYDLALHRLLTEATRQAAISFLESHPPRTQYGTQLMEAFLAKKEKEPEEGGERL
jgi:hypothetical protein